MGKKKFDNGLEINKNDPIHNVIGMSSDKYIYKFINKIYKILIKIIMKHSNKF